MMKMAQNSDSKLFAEEGTKEKAKFSKHVTIDVMKIEPSENQVEKEMNLVKEAIRCLLWFFLGILLLNLIVIVVPYIHFPWRHTDDEIPAQSVLDKLLDIEDTSVLITTGDSKLFCLLRKENDNEKKSNGAGIMSLQSHISLKIDDKQGIEKVFRCWKQRDLNKTPFQINIPLTRI